jgi:hypothetical protein
MRERRFREQHPIAVLEAMAAADNDVAAQFDL